MEKTNQNEKEEEMIATSGRIFSTGGLVLVPPKPHAIGTITVGDKLLAIDYDDHAPDPRSYDNLGKLALFHKRYELANETDISIQDFSSWHQLERLIRKRYNAEIILPVFMYDHSGIALGTTREYPFSDPWDAGQVGFVFASREAILDNFTGYLSDGTREPMKQRVSKKMGKQTIDILNSEIGMYSKWLGGFVMCFTVYQIHTEGCYKMIDSCGDFYELVEMVNYVPEEFRECLLVKEFDRD